MILKIRQGGIMIPPQVHGQVDQFIIELQDGTPVMAGFEKDGALILSKAGDPDFQKMLNTLGYEGKAPHIDSVSFPSL